MTHRYSESGGGFCGICDDAPGEGEHAPKVVEEQGRYVGYGEYTIAELQARSHQQSKDKGFHDYQPASDRERTSLNAERIALMHSELSEALEELRKGGVVHSNYYPNHGFNCATNQDGSRRATLPACDCTPKPEGVPSEMADVVIRVMDFCGANGIDLQAAIIEKLDFNATRPAMHGGKAF